MIVTRILVLLTFFFSATVLAETANTSDSVLGSAPALVGGSPAAAGHQPWMAALVRTTTGRSFSELEFCGATLIAPEWLITAAHCVYSELPERMLVVIGRNDLNAAGGVVHEVQEIVPHPDFGLHGDAGDLALIRLAEASTAEVLPLLDAAQLGSLYGTKLAVFGWGNTFDDDSIDCELFIDDGGKNSSGYRCDTYATQVLNNPPSLQMIAQGLKTLAECQARIAELYTSLGQAEPQPGDEHYFDETDRSLCLWDDAETSTVCFGDSGGPLVAQVNGKAMLVGVVNSGRARCGLELAYALYADVTQYHDFINRTMARNPVLGFDSICPAQVLLDDVHYAEPNPDTGRRQVTLNWTGVEYAEHYRLWFTPTSGSSAAVGQLQLPATDTSFSAELNSGDGYLVAVQASNALCDGFRSASARVSVP